MIRKRTFAPCLRPFWASALAALASAAAPPVQEPSAAEVQQDGDSDATPRGAVRHYLEACRAGDYERAALFLDLDALPAEERAAEGPVLARRLKVVLDRTTWVDLAALSADPHGDLGEALPADLERLTTLELERAGPVDVVLRRARRADGTEAWRFSAATVARIPALYQEFGYGRLGEILPRHFFERSFLEVQLWQWIGILLVALGAHLLSWALLFAAHALARPLVARSRTELDDRLLALVAKPLRLLVGLALFSWGLRLLALAVPVERFLLGLQQGLLVLGIAWLFLRAVDVLSGLLRERLLRDGKSSAVAALPLGEKSLKVVVLGFAGIALLQNLGFNVTGLIAGLGVGGLALALAAQKTVENLFGGVSLILDQPVRVGDACRFGDTTGTVEDIGLRSTRIRTLERTVVSVPNADFATLRLENFARRDKFRFATRLGLRYETTADQLRWVLAELRRLLLAHARVEADPVRVRFVGYGAHALEVDVCAHVSARDQDEFLGVQEDLLLRVMDIVNESGTGFAFPSSTTYLARDGGLDAERARRAEERVAAWRREGRLPFPDFAAGFKDDVAGSIEYPSRDSAVAPRS
jgi:MscS family membrane protein